MPLPFAWLHSDRPRYGWRESDFIAVVIALLVLTMLAMPEAVAAAGEPHQAAAAAGDYGTVTCVDAAGVIRLVPWGKKPTAAFDIPTRPDASVLINLESGKLSDLREGMWLKVLERAADGKARRITAGQFVQEVGDKVVLFKGMPEEFLVYGSEGWYTNIAAGIQFKIQPMGAGKSPSNPGTNLRPAKYREPAGGFVVYFPTTLKGAVLNWEGCKPGANMADADGKVLINKETCGETYWKHRKNPGRPEAGDVSGLTELTIRKLPTRP